jgi:hypothetical protein
LKDILVLESNDSHPNLQQVVVSGPVVVQLMTVGVTVDFDGKSGCMTIEICDETLDDLLAAEVKSVEPAPA